MSSLICGAVEACTSMDENRRCCLGLLDIVRCVVSSDTDIGLCRLSQVPRPVLRIIPALDRRSIALFHSFRLCVELQPLELSFLPVTQLRRTVCVAGSVVLPNWLAKSQQTVRMVWLVNRLNSSCRGSEAHEQESNAEVQYV